jgi:hypothetical protein
MDAIENTEKIMFTQRPSHRIFQSKPGEFRTGEVPGGLDPARFGTIMVRHDW